MNAAGINPGSPIAQDPVWITEAEVVQMMSLHDAIGALEQALRLEAEGHAASMAKTLLQYDGGNNLHALGGRLGAYVGTKTWAHTDQGTCPLLLLWNAHDGQLAAVIEAFALGNMRTGGISGLATDWMARPDAHVLAMAGTGKQALSQVAAVMAVRPLTQVRVFSRTPASRAAFAERVCRELGVDAVACADMASACQGADIVTLATRAREPFVDAAMLAPGTHLNAVGAIAPDREEFSQDVFDRAGAPVVDALPGTRALSREFRTRFGDTPDSAGWSSVKPLSALIHQGQRRLEQADLSLFKAMGMGLSDLALGTALLARAREQRLGRTLAAPRKAKPRLVATAPAAVVAK